MNLENEAYCREQLRELGLSIAYYRRKKGLSQAKLAEISEISRQHLGAIESPNMARPVSIEAVFKIARALEVEPWELLKFGNKN